MTVALAEAHNLVFDRRAVPRTAALDLTGIHWRAVHVGANDRVGRRGRAGDAAFDLAVGDALSKHGERLRRVVAWLHFHAGPVDGGAVEPRRRAGLQSSELKACPLKGRGKAE